MTEPSITQVENAFVPSQEIDDPDRFAGRIGQVSQAYLALHSHGTNVAIIGNRGIGKSSLARQVIRLASGNNELLEKLGLPYTDRLDYLPVYFACGRSVRDYHELLHRLLTTKDCLNDWLYYSPVSERETSQLSGKIDLKLASTDAGQHVEYERQIPITDQPLDTIFTNVVTAITKSGVARNGLLVVVDEFDQIGNPDGVASFLKSLATNAPMVRFCLVGVAQDIRNLMREHESTDRLFAGGIINMPPMASEELEEIIEIAEQSIAKAITFSAGARRHMIQLAQGHPYMIHLIGKFSLREAFRGKSQRVDANDIQHTLHTIAQAGLDPVLEGRYKKAIGTSPQREIVLKAMAGSQAADGEILTTDAYKFALDNGVENSSQYVGQLVTEEYGMEIEKVRDRYYRFRDSLFHAYVCARPPVFR